MKGDFTRDTFDPSKHFSRVLMQQGRVQLDADRNEQTAILLHYLRTLAKDILGPHAGPASDLGFEIITDETPGANAKIDAFEPDPTRRQALKDALSNGNAVIAPGRYYVQGVLVESHRAILYTEQPGYGSGSQPKLEDIQKWQSGLLAYLDVWERHITYVEDDHIREAALLGPDTCTRAQVVWQVKVLFQPQNVNVFGCGSVSLLPPLGTGRLRARARLDKPPTELCVIPPESRYRGAENQLYRVEVHRGGTATGANGATFKWSRENGSVVFPIRSLSGTTATLENLGRDLHLGLKPGDWVEVVDDAIALGEEAGPLAQVDVVNRDDLTVTLKLATGTTSPPSYTEGSAETQHALLRRWDHAGDPAVFGGALAITEQDNTEQGLKTGWIKLEDGVEIWFAKGGQYRAGDYWLIPARTATGDVEWLDEVDASGTPRFDADGNPLPALSAAHGPYHYYAPLLVTGNIPDTDRRFARDCRCAIRHLPCASYQYAFGGSAIGPDF
ncbi:MAG: DUF6519 domain-containing protein [Betaproteobacteria bacterium]|nr:DUF6519 domain-containing protein [Betaproteobacteria bacterium]MDH3435928.1 DUF6519 domain-containing protein [Betaproteobacteria bacterium]